MFHLTQIYTCRQIFLIKLMRYMHDCEYKRKRNGLYFLFWKKVVEIILHILLSQVMGKLTFGICKNKGADQLHGTVKLITTFVFITGIVQCHYFLNLKLSAFSQLLFLHSLICVRASCWFSNQECWFSHENA